VIVQEGEIADRVYVKALRSGLVCLARIAFQACSFNHSDISPFKWNQQFTGGRRPAQPQTVT
jgi:hypothetical protein